MIDYLMQNDYIIPIAFAVFWFGYGLYGMLANIERVPRVWGKTEAGDGFQHVLTLLLGPFGVAMVMSSGGREKFWRKS